MSETLKMLICKFQNVIEINRAHEIAKSSEFKRIVDSAMLSAASTKERSVPLSKTKQRPIQNKVFNYSQLQTDGLPRKHGISSNEDVNGNSVSKGIFKARNVRILLENNLIILHKFLLKSKSNEKKDLVKKYPIKVHHIHYIISPEPVVHKKVEPVVEMQALENNQSVSKNWLSKLIGFFNCHSQ